MSRAVGIHRRCRSCFHSAFGMSVVYDRAMELPRLFAYDDWANREEIARLRVVGAPPRAVRLLAHVIGTEWLWIARIRGSESRLAVWPELSLDECETEADMLRDAWNGVLHGS